MTMPKSLFFRTTWGCYTRPLFSDFIPLMTTASAHKPFLFDVASRATKDALEQYGVLTHIDRSVVVLEYFNREGATYFHRIPVPSGASDDELASYLCAPEFVAAVRRGDREARKVLR